MSDRVLSKNSKDVSKLNSGKKNSTDLVIIRNLQTKVFDRLKTYKKSTEIDRKS